MKKFISAILSLAICLTPMTVTSFSTTAAGEEDTSVFTVGSYVGAANDTTAPSASPEIRFEDELTIKAGETKEFKYTYSSTDKISFEEQEYGTGLIISNEYENGKGVLTVTAREWASNEHKFWCYLGDLIEDENGNLHREGLYLVDLNVLFHCPDCGRYVTEDEVVHGPMRSICKYCYDEGGYVGTTTGTSTTITTTTTTDTELPAPNGSCGDDLTWRLDGDTLVISGKGAMDDFPFGSPFLDLKYKEVIFPDALTSIGVNAFANSGLPIEPQNGLERAEIPDSVTSIGDWAFYGCIDLAEVTIPESVTTIGNEVFKNCPKLTLKGYTGSYAETYAKENDIPFEAISETTDTTTTTTTTTTVESTDTETTTSYIRSTPVGFISYDSLPDEVLMQSGEEMTLNFMGMYITGVKAVSSDETIVKAAAELGSGVFTQTGTVTLNAVKTDKTKTAEVEFFYETFVPQDGGSKVIKVTVAGEKDAPVESTDQAFVNVSYVKFPAGSKSPIHLRHYLAQNIRFTSDCEYISFERGGFNTPGIVQTSDDPSVIILEDEYTKEPTSGNMYVIVDENAPTCTAEVTMTYTSLSTNKDVTKKFKIDILSKEDAGQTTTTTSSVITTTTTTQPSTDALDRVGDANCDDQVNMADAVFIMQCIANPDKYTLTEQGRKNADADKSGDITNKDALTIQKFKLHIIDNFS